MKYIVYKNCDNNKFKSVILKRNFDKIDLRSIKETVFIYSTNTHLLKQSMFAPMKQLLWQESFTKQL